MTFHLYRCREIAQFKNKLMFCSSLTWFIFNLHKRACIYISYQTHIKSCMQRFKFFNVKKNPLMSDGSSLYEVANPYPCWSQAQSQLPHFRSLPAPPPPISFSPPSHQCLQLSYTDYINIPASSYVGHKKSCFSRFI